MAEALTLWSVAPGNSEQIPTLTYYKSECKTSDSAALIFPGGAYNHFAEHEGKSYALFLNSLGMDAFVLEYRIAPAHFPLPLIDARRAACYIRHNAEEFGIDKDKLLVMGSSAGGHLAAFLSTYKGEIDGEGADEIDEIDYMPNGQILCYPVIEPIGHLLSFKNFSGGREELFENYMPSGLVDTDTPPAFMWHTARDQSVNVLNTISYAKALKEHDVSCELHIFPDGMHSLAMSLGEDKISKHVHSWTELLVNWLTYMNF